MEEKPKELSYQQGTKGYKRYQPIDVTSILKVMGYYISKANNICVKGIFKNQLKFLHWLNPEERKRFMIKNNLQIPDIIINKHQRKEGAIVMDYGKGLKKAKILEDEDVVMFMHCDENDTVHMLKYLEENYEPDELYVTDLKKEYYRIKRAKKSYCSDSDYGFYKCKKGRGATLTYVYYL